MLAFQQQNHAGQKQPSVTPSCPKAVQKEQHSAQSRGRRVPSSSSLSRRAVRNRKQPGVLTLPCAQWPLQWLFPIHLTNARVHRKSFSVVEICISYDTISWVERLFLHGQEGVHQQHTSEPSITAGGVWHVVQTFFPHLTSLQAVMIRHQPPHWLHDGAGVPREKGDTLGSGTCTQRVLPPHTPYRHGRRWKLAEMQLRGVSPRR